MRTLGNCVGVRINVFDDLEKQTVETFNSLFPECMLDFDNDITVKIGLPAPNNCRELKIGNALLIHKMYSDILYTLDRQDFYTDERDLELNEINGVML